MKIFRTTFWGAALLLTLVVLLVQCGRQSTDSSGNESDDEVTPDDDAAVDDDSSDDDSSDDDHADDDMADDDVVDSPPIITDEHFDPPYTELVKVDWSDELQYASVLYWQVCDTGNNLLPDGQFVYAPFCNGQMFDPILLSQLQQYADGDLSDAGDCNHPVTIGMLVVFGPESDPYIGRPPGEVCMTFWASDDADNVSDWHTACVMHDPT
jgi:hypothetical protein